MVDLAATIWRPTIGEGEATQSNGALITTESGLNLTTESGLLLQIEDGSYTELASTVWVESEGE